MAESTAELSAEQSAEDAGEKAKTARSSPKKDGRTSRQNAETTCQGCAKGAFKKNLGQGWSSVAGGTYTLCRPGSLLDNIRNPYFARRGEITPLLNLRPASRDSIK